MNCANVGPLNCLQSGGGPAMMDCSPGGAGGGGSGGGMYVSGSEFRSSSQAMLRSKHSSSFHDPCGPGSSESDNVSQQYLEGARRVLDTMNRLWQEQKLCDVIIQAQCDQLKAHKIALAAYSDFLVDKFCKFPAGWLMLP